MKLALILKPTLHGGPIGSTAQREGLKPTLFTYEDAGLDGMSDIDVLENEFARFNIGGDEIAREYRDQNLRSMSVGDILVLDCQSVGSPDVGTAEVEDIVGKLKLKNAVSITLGPAARAYQVEPIGWEEYDIIEAGRLILAVQGKDLGESEG